MEAFNAEMDELGLEPEPQAPRKNRNNRTTRPGYGPYSPSHSPTRDRVPQWTKTELGVLLAELFEEKEFREKHDPGAKVLRLFPQLPVVDHRLSSTWQIIASEFEDRKKTARQCSAKWKLTRLEFEEVKFLVELGGSLWDDKAKRVRLQWRDWQIIGENDEQLLRWKSLPFPWFDDILYLLDRSIKPGRSYLNYRERSMYRTCEDDSEDDDPESCVKYLKCRKRGGIHSYSEKLTSKYAHVPRDAHETSFLQFRKDDQDDSEHDEDLECAEKAAKTKYLRWIARRRHLQRTSKWIYDEPEDKTPPTFQYRAIIKIRDEEILSDRAILAMTKKFLKSESLAQKYLFFCGRKDRIRERWILVQLQRRRQGGGAALPRKDLSAVGISRMVDVDNLLNYGRDKSLKG